MTRGAGQSQVMFPEYTGRSTNETSHVCAPCLTGSTSPGGAGPPASRLLPALSPSAQGTLSQWHLLAQAILQVLRQRGRVSERVGG